MSNPSQESPQTPAAKGDEEGALTLGSVLWKEFAAIHGAQQNAAEQTEEGFYKTSLEQEQSALCLSGGGIRSASFALGVMQALARLGLLTQFDYLSTVSGGGYIGGWLSAWRRADKDLDKIAKRLNEFPEPDQLKQLRVNSNFLTPKVGLTSADTWSGIAIYVRNLVLNWLVLGPLMLAVIGIPYLSLALVNWAMTWKEPSTSSWVLAVAAASSFAALTVSVANRPPNHQGIGQLRYLGLVAAPTYATAVLLTLYAAHFGPLQPPDGKLFHYIFPWLCGGAAVYAVAWIAGVKFNKLRSAGTAQPEASQPEVTVNPAETVTACKRVGLFAAWVFSGIVAGGLIGTGIYLWSGLSGFHLWWPERHLGSELGLAVFGVGWVMASMLIAEALYIGLSSHGPYGDMDREWLARSSGWLAALSIARILFALVVLASAVIFWSGRDSFISQLVISAPTAQLSLKVPELLSDIGPVFKQIFAAIGTVLGVVSGAVTLFLGSSKKTAATDQKPRIFSLFQILSIATGFFLLFLTLVLATLFPAVAKLFGSVLDSVLDLVGLTIPWQNPAYGHALLFAVLMAALVAFSFVASAFVNINRFSLHAAYRNRMVRAFLGSAREPKRAPNLFTGFDPKDNFSVSELAQLHSPESGGGKLFHVINMALNVVASKNLAWQERKAESFVVTPLASGSGNPKVQFRYSKEFAQRISMGTALAISGAAASPNMGYISSPIVGILMTLFNVRLGWWLGNPRWKKFFKVEGPRLALMPLVQELFGLTTDDAAYVYLSDGGHFENLGIYEMVRRRCRLIVVSDAGQDPNFEFYDIGSAIRKARIDLGVDIAFKGRIMIKRASVKKPGSEVYAAYGKITYKDFPKGDPNNEGILLYLKPTLYGSEPTDIRAYAAQHDVFPHDTTADQWFSESQMESYRALGEFVVMSLATQSLGGEDKIPKSLKVFLEAVRTALRPDLFSAAKPSAS